MQASLTNAGEPIRSLTAGGFLLIETVHPPSWTNSRHVHQSPSMGVLLNGSYKETIGRRSQECAAHSLQVFPGGESHTVEIGPSHVHYLTIDFCPSALETICQVSPVLESPVNVRNGTVAALVVRLYREFRLMDNTALLTIEGLILELLGGATKIQQPRSSKEPPWLRQAKEFVHENARTGVSLIALATLVGVHPSYLARMFRRHYGCSVGDYVVRLRLDFAIRELINSDLSLAEIASAAGFYDQSHFTHVFKFHFGITPSNLRAIAKKGRRKYK